MIFIDIFAAVGPRGEPFYPHIARSIVAYANTNGNCVLVVSATCPNELELVREFASNMPILISGIAALRADAANVVSAGKDSRGKGMITNSSRDIIFASSGENFAEAALFLSAEKLYPLLEPFSRIHRLADARRTLGRGGIPP